MAIRKGEFISGAIGPVVSRELNGKQVLQSMPEKYQLTEGSKAAGLRFGKSSTVATFIRDDFSRVHDGYYDSEMVSRCMSATRRSLEQCFDKESGIYQIKSDSFNRLNGFEFNLKSLLIDFLWARPQITLINDQLLIRLPKTKVPAELKFPADATSCVRKLNVAFYDPAKGNYYVNRFKLAPVQNIKGTIDAEEFTFVAPKGMLCFVSMALIYYAESYGNNQLLNNKQFNPAGICQVIVNPGVFDIKDLEIQQPYKYWTDKSDLILNGVVFLTADGDRADGSELILPKSKKTKPAKVQKTDKTEKDIRKAEARTIAGTLKNMGIAIAEIAKATGLSVKQVEKL